MKKLSLLILALIGGLILVLFTGVSPLELAAALEPTPTPTAAPVTGADDETTDIACHLSTSEECEFIDPTTQRPAALPGDDLPYKVYPALGVQGVPTSTLISIVFDRSVDPSSVNGNTVFVSQGSQRIDGAVNYINAGKIAIFHPAVPLRPSATYTVTVTRGIRDLSGTPLVQDVIWSFTTSAGISPLSEALTQGKVALPGTGMNIYFGDLHSHSLLSDGAVTAAEAFQIARAVGLDFFALTDHCFMLTPDEWQTMLIAANAVTGSDFVGLRGFEYTHLYGHINVFNTDTYVHRDDPNYNTLAKFYAWLVEQPTAIAQFNHPLISEWHDWNFDDFAYNPAADHKIVLRELSNATQYFLSLDTGWHLGAVGNSDAHGSNFGERRMGIVAPTLTREAIIEALKARRTFFASPNDLNFAVVMQANGAWMGSAIPNAGTINFVIRAYDPDPTGRSLRLNLYNNGVVVASTTLPGQNLYTWTVNVPAALGHYYYVEAYHGHWLYPAYSSPIWVERPPIAKTGPSQVVPLGAVVTLQDAGSQDPDGDALVYQWSQQAGPPASLTNAHKTTATFVAGSVGELVFNLTVTDPGSLSASETMVVTVTDKPILSITKTGPVAAEPDELINYVLMVVNHGITPAQDVVVTDVIPAGATYVSGGSLAGDIVSWTIPELAANGGVATVSFAVTTSGTIINGDYGASCLDCIPAKGEVRVVTNGPKIYIPILRWNK